MGYLMNKIDVNGRVIRWLFLLQEFDITILDKLGKHNVVAYFLSRLTHDADKELVDEHLFAISVQTPWFVDIENYLATRKLPQHLSYKEKCKIIRQSATYEWIKSYLFKLGPDKFL